MKFNLSRVKFSRNDIKRGLKLPTKLNEQLAEDIGVMIGDGHIGKSISPKKAINYEISCSGNAITDRTFYKDYVRNLKKNLFNLNLNFSDKKKNTCVIRIYSKGLLEFYTKIIGLPLGKKGNIKIPSSIFKSTNKIKCSFIRGLADSDFTLTFRKKYKNKLYYPLIRMRTISKPLIKDLNKLLISFGFKTTFSYDLKNIHPLTKTISIESEVSLNGRENLEKWMKLIGTNNPKNILKYKLWKKNGFCPRNEEITKIIKKGLKGFEPSTTSPK